MTVFALPEGVHDNLFRSLELGRAEREMITG